MLGSPYKQNPLDLSKFYIPSPETFPWIISCRVQRVEQWDLKFGGGRFGHTGIIWDVNIRQENGHGPQTFSALQGQTQHISLTLVTTPRVCIGAVPGVHTLSTAEAGTRCLLRGLTAMPPPTHALRLCPGKVRVERRQEGGLRGTCFLSLHGGQGWETDRVYTSLRSSKVQKWFSK